MKISLGAPPGIWKYNLTRAPAPTKPNTHSVMRVSHGCGLLEERSPVNLTHWPPREQLS
jgi:hypothetical protein